MLYNNGSEININDTFTQQNINDGTISYTHNGSETVEDEFIFTVSDGAGGVIGNTTFEIEITPVNQPIVVNELTPAAGDSTIFEMENIPFSIDAYDPEGNELNYSWMLDGEEVSTVASYDFNTDYNFVDQLVASSRDYSLVLNVNDNSASKRKYKNRKNTRDELQFNWTITVLDVNVAPVIELVPDVVFTEDETEELELETYASDFDQLDTSTLDFSVAISVHSNKKSNKRVTKANSRTIVEAKNGKKVYSIRLDDTDLSVEIDNVTHIATFSTSQDSSGVFDVVFTVIDDSLATDTDAILVTVNPQNDAPSPFSLITPEENAEVSTTPTFIWEKAHDIDQDIVNYELNIYDASSILISTLEAGADTTFTVSTNSVLVPGSNYSWDVIALDGTDSTVSIETNRPFIVAETINPEFNLVSPSNNTIFEEKTIDFVWEESETAVSYEIFIYSEATGEIKTQEEVTINEITINGTGLLTNNKSYLWTVNSYNAEGDTLQASDGEKWKFTIREFVTSEDLESPNVIKDGVNDEIVFNSDPDIDKIAIYTIQGKLAKILSKNSNGQYSWNGTLGGGNKIGPGTYMYQIIKNGKVLRNGLVGVVR